MIQPIYCTSSGDTYCSICQQINTSDVHLKNGSSNPAPRAAARQLPSPKPAFEEASQNYRFTLPFVSLFVSASKPHSRVSSTVRWACRWPQTEPVYVESSTATAKLRTTEQPTNEKRNRESCSRMQGLKTVKQPQLSSAQQKDTIGQRERC